MANKTLQSLGDYVKDVFDLNRDGRVTFKEALTTMIPSQAVGIALLVVDLLALIGEYRVWQVGMQVSGGDKIIAAGFVAVSLVPFYLAQVLWLYPLANFWQQAIAVIMGIAALYTSAEFGFADLSQNIDLARVSRWVINLWFFYIVLLLLYAVSDRAFKLLRHKIQARANARFQGDMNTTANEILADLEQSLVYEQRLRERFGDDAVEAHIQMLNMRKGKGQHNQPAQLPAPASPAPAPQPQKQYPNWELDPFLRELGLNRAEVIGWLGNSPDDFYNTLRPHGVERIEISRKNFNRLYGQLRNGKVPVNPTNPPRH